MTAVEEITLSELKEYLDERFAQIEKQFDDQNELFAGIGKQNLEVLARIERIENQVQRMENRDLISESQQALQTLGYSAQDAEKGILAAIKEGGLNRNAKDLIKRALRILPD